MEAMSEATLQEESITKGISGHEELKIYLARKLFSIEMSRFHTPTEVFVDAIGYVERFGSTKGVKNTICKYESSRTNDIVEIHVHGSYEEPMTQKGIEELYDTLCSKLGR